MVFTTKGESSLPPATGCRTSFQARSNGIKNTAEQRTGWLLVDEFR
jgi:hypothetical protein